MKQLPLIVIVGPTGSGKTSLAIRLAKDFNGEIISADSRAIYRGLDIGTAKPTMVEREGIPHWGIDIVNPGDRFTAADFKEYATDKIREIRARGHIPMLVGGTGLYVDAVLYDYQFPVGGDDARRRDALSCMTLDELYVYCKKNNVKLPENYKNKRYVVNSILRNGHDLKKRSDPLPNTYVVGISTEKNILKQRLRARARMIFASDIVNEATTAAATFGWGNEAMTGNIYPLIHEVVKGVITTEEAIERFEVLDWHLAKRQLTWFKRNQHTVWRELDEAYTYIAQHLVEVFRP